MPEWAVHWIFGLITGFLIAIAVCRPAHANEHWPVEPLTSVTCEKVQGLSIHPDAISALYYNSVLGVLLLTYQFADGTTIETHWSVTDLMHERAADYTIQLTGPLTMYRIVYRERTELWIDAKGEGNCRDFKRQE